MPSAHPAVMHGTVPDNEKTLGFSGARAHSDFVTAFCRVPRGFELDTECNPSESGSADA